MNYPSRKMAKQKTYQLGEVLGFGKYTGCTVEMIIEVDPKYMQWCADNIDGFCLSDGAKRRLQERFREDMSVTQSLKRQ